MSEAVHYYTIAKQYFSLYLDRFGEFWFPGRHSLSVGSSLCGDPRWGGYLKPIWSARNYWCYSLVASNGYHLLQKRKVLITHSGFFLGRLTMC